MSPGQAAGQARLLAHWGADNLQLLEGKELQRVSGRSDIAVWQTSLPPDYVGKTRVLSIGLSTAFPFEAAIAWVDPEAFLVWPHCGSDGKLCLWPPDTEPGWLNAEAAVDAFLERLTVHLRLVQPESDPLERVQHFADEWASYWRCRGNINAIADESILLLEGTTDDVSLGTSAAITFPKLGFRKHAERWLLVANSDVKLQDWMERAGIEAPARVTNVLRIRLKAAPTIPGAPRMLTEVVLFFKAWAQAPSRAQVLFKELIEDPTDVDRWLVFEFQNTSTALRFRPQHAAQRSKGWQGAKKKQYDRDHPTRTGFAITSVLTQRGDLNWLHGRGFDAISAQLAAMHVAIVGVGSLGSFMTEGLCLAGVGQLTLIDHGILESANVGRHLLGIQSLGLPKAAAVASVCSEHYPHLQLTAYDESVMSGIENIEHALATADLVVSTTANPGVEGHLIEKLRELGIRHLMVAWSEPHAIAGHGLQGRDADVLADQFDDGRFCKPCVEFSQEQSIPLPGCGGSHLPGGGNRIRLIASMVAEHCVETLTSERPKRHSTWMADRHIIEALGGTLKHFV